MSPEQIITKASMSDLDSVLAIYAYAREFMRKNGNPNQWETSRPSEDVVRSDIERGQLYKIVREGEICGVFAFISGDDPTYRVIDGRWLNDEPYGAIHRLAAAEGQHGIFAAALDFCQKLCKNIRIDTHENNAPMLRLLDKHGFCCCGIIVTDDGTKRRAYQKVVQND